MKSNVWLVIVILLVISAILLVAYNVLKSTEREIAEQFNSQQLIVANEVALLIEKFFKKTIDELDMAAFYIGESGLKSKESTPLLKKLFTNLQVDGTIVKTAIIDKNGEIVSQYPEPEHLIAEENTGFNNKEYFIFSKQTLKPFISEAVMNKGRREITISFPIAGMVKDKKQEGREFQGILACFIDVRELAQTFLKPVRTASKGYAWILNEEGTLLYHPSHPEMIWKNIFENDGSCFQCHKNFINEKNMVEGKIGTREYIVRTGEKKLIAYYPIRLYGKTKVSFDDKSRKMEWSIAVSTPYSEVISLLKKSNRNIFILTGLVVLVIFFGSAYLIWVNIRKVKAEEKMLWGEKVLEAKNRLQTLFDGITDGISIIDKDYRVVAINKGQVKMSGKTEEELFGQLCYEEFTDKDGICEGCPVEVTLTTGEPSTGERIVKKDSGEKRYWSMLTFPLKDSEGRTSQVIKYVRDITEQKKMNEEIEQSRRLSSMGAMIAGVAHEIKNPLQNISMGLGIVKYETEGNKECLQTVEDMMKGVKSLNAIVQDLLDFSKPMSLEAFECDINDIIEEVLMNMREVFDKSRVRIIKDYYPEKRHIRIDGMKIKQVFINLIQNAIEAMPEGGEINIATKFLFSNGRNCSEIRIKDTGSGIEEENFSRIFDPFFTTKSKGVGLGMAIVQRIIRLHEGEITVGSEKGNGTEFIIHLFDKS